MAKRTIVITGASDGIGAAAARELVRRGEHVVVVGRSKDKTAALATELDTDYVVADYADLQQVRALATELLERFPHIDVLANNAGGIMGTQRELTVDGHEKTFQVNHLAPFLLTTLLIDRLVASNAVVLNTSSVGNKAFGHLDIDDLESARKYSSTKAYGDAKLATILFTKELHRRYQSQGISTAAFHPGNVATNFSSEPGTPLIMRVMYRTPLKHLFLISPEKGAEELVWLATSQPGTDWQSGEYYDAHKLGKANVQAADTELAQQLWDRSESLVGASA